MPNVYEEARPKGRPEGRKITCSPRSDAEIGNRAGRKEHLNDKKIPHHWRAA